MRGISPRARRARRFLSMTLPRVVQETGGRTSTIPERYGVGVTGIPGVDFAVLMYSEWVSEPGKIRYEIDLTKSKFDVYREPVDTISPDDLHPLAQLMLDAYQGTIDFEDETLEDAVSEVSSYFDGVPLLDHSLQIRSDGRPVSAILVSKNDGDAFIRYVMTDPAHKGRGLATQIANRTLASLQAAGYKRVVLYITDGNKPSKRVFRGLGAVPRDER